MVLWACKGSYSVTGFNLVQDLEFRLEDCKAVAAWTVRCCYISLRPNLQWGHQFGLRPSLFVRCLTDKALYLIVNFSIRKEKNEQRHTVFKPLPTRRRTHPTRGQAQFCERLKLYSDESSQADYTHADAAGRKFSTLQLHMRRLANQCLDLAD